MSTELITYLNFISSLKDATDQQLNDIISERASFILLGKSDMMDHLESGVNKVFDNIDSLAKKLEEEEIAEESIRLAEDAAAVGAIWSFGLSMAVYSGLVAIDKALSAEIKAKESDLNKALTNADKDIGSKMGDACLQYIEYTKKNNNFLKDSSPAGLSAHTARSYLYSYMDFLSTHGGMGLENFRKYIQVAEETQNDPNIDKIYDLLDEFHLSGDRGEKKVKEVLGKINGAGVNTTYMGLVRGFTCAIWVYKMKVSAGTLSKAAKEAGGVPPEESKFETLKNMDTLGKAMASITIILSVIDAFLNVYNIVETIERYEENIKVLHKARQQYKDFYTNLYKASVEYKPQE